MPLNKETKPSVLMFFMPRSFIKTSWTFWWIQFNSLPKLRAFKRRAGLIGNLTFVIFFLVNEITGWPKRNAIFILSNIQKSHLASLVYLFYDISTPYGLFDTEILFINKGLITTIFSIFHWNHFSKIKSFSFVYNHLFALTYMTSSITISYK